VKFFFEICSYSVILHISTVLFAYCKEESIIVDTNRPVFKIIFILYAIF
jgi:hypothetical protein